MLSLKLLALTALAALLPISALRGQSYNFTVIAGLPPQVGSTDGSATQARFTTPFATATDAAGNVFVADIVSHTIRKITPAGVVTTLAGLAGQTGSADGRGSAARFNSPNGVTADSAGNVFVADFSNNAIRKITPDGTVTTFAGLPGSVASVDGTGTAARFLTPAGITCDGSDNLYVCDYNAHTIRKITPAGVVTTLAGLSRNSGSLDATGSNARFLNPNAIALDPAGTLYVADTGNNTIRKITPQGVVTTLAGFAGQSGSTNGVGSGARFNAPTSLAVTNDANVFVVDSTNQVIRQITPAGTVSTFAGSLQNIGSSNGQGTAARFFGPIGIAIDRSGNFYVADYYNRSIRKITPDGVVSDFAGPGGTFGSTDGVGQNARFNEPRAIAVDSAENLYVADSNNYTVRKIKPDGTVTTFAGLAGTRGSVNGTGGAARLGYIEGLATDRSDNLYATDGTYDAIRLINPEGTVSTFAGVPGLTGRTNGPATSALFNTPTAIATDTAGNFYVADTYNQTIRKISADGTVSTLAGLAGTTGTADGAGSAARFNYPTSLVVDASGTLYVSDTDNHTVRKITADGTVSTLAGLAGTSDSTNGSGALARFNHPRGLVLERAGTLLLTDTDNHLIRRITTRGEVTTVAGLPTAFESTDGSGTNAHFYHPIGIALGKSGSIYVVDVTANTVIRGDPIVAPAITIQPQSLTVLLGSTVVLAPAATGGGLTYQWKLNGVDVPGATNATLTLPNFQAFSAGTYTLVITNAVGTATTQPATLTISTTADFGRISNLAIRAPAGTGSQTLIVGVALGGSGTSGTKPVLIRAVGPALIPFGVTGTLPDPFVSVYQGTTSVASNDNWSTDPQAAAIAAQVGAFSLGAAPSKDAALYQANFAINSYTVQVTDTSGATGVALAEIYDATPPGSFAATTPRLVNVSARTQVGTGGDILIAGFVLGGSTAKTVLIRAVGPGLTQFGVTGALLDPRLDLYRGDTLIQSNDNWGGTAALSAAFSSVGAFQLTPATSKDSVILVTLAPGAYTAQVSGVANTTGVALIEVYEVP